MIGDSSTGCCRDGNTVERIADEMVLTVVVGDAMLVSGVTRPAPTEPVGNPGSNTIAESRIR